MGRQSNRHGRCGEEYAAAWLQRQGAVLLERNWRCSLGEVDIIAQMGEYLCFVEVKTRLRGSLNAPEEAVDWKKKRRIVYSAQQYLLSHPKTAALQPRFDVAAVILREKEMPEIAGFSYLPGAFTCDGL